LFTPRNEARQRSNNKYKAARSGTTVRVGLADRQREDLNLMSVAPRRLSASSDCSTGKLSNRTRAERFKVAIELVTAFTILLATTPIILLAALLVRLTSRGRVVYTQIRLGKDGKPFTIYKIRTMYENSEPDGPRWSPPGDPRVTPIGWVLRACHIDELPQLFNVLRGEMSLIGPRPERPEIVTQLERVFPDYRRRLAVRPGVTGLAQVLQAPDTDLESVRRKLQFDLHYLESWSLRLDSQIVMATVLHLVHLPAPLIARAFGFPGEFPRQSGSERSLPDPIAGSTSTPLLSEV
jgi:lipopolysaccharide/colanic/teichoic acid biosynthesis glycosyltransferase